MWQITCYRGSAVITALVLSLLATSAHAVPSFFARSEITATVSTNADVDVSVFSDLIPCPGGCTEGGATEVFSQFPPPGNARTWFAETEYLGGTALAAGNIDAGGTFVDSFPGLTIENFSGAEASISVLFNIVLSVETSVTAFSEAANATAIAEIGFIAFNADGDETASDLFLEDADAGLEFDFDGPGTDSLTRNLSYGVNFNLVDGGWAEFDILATAFGFASDIDPDPPVGVPEPSTLGLLAAGLVGLVATRRRRQVP